MEYVLVATWLVMYLLFMGLGTPITSAWLSPLADRGASVAMPLTMAAFVLVAYYVGHVSLTLGLWVGLVVLVGLFVGALVRGPPFDREAFAEVAVVFSLAFLFLVALRSFDPAVHPGGGEKFLDFGLLKSLWRAGSLPPVDMWFAGKPVRYYYGGHLLVTLLCRLTGTAPRYGYNLALAGFYAMLVTGAYGLAGTLAARGGASRRLGGTFGAVFVGVASNLAPPARLLVWALPGRAGRWLAATLGVRSTSLAHGPESFSYWRASRVIADTVGGHQAYLITEFPLFAWLNGDLHAHMMSQPFLLVTVAVVATYASTPEAERGRRRLLVFGFAPTLAGVLALVNTWSFPTAGGLVALTLALAPAAPHTLFPATVSNRLDGISGYAREGVRLASALGCAAVVVTLGVVWSLPFWLRKPSNQWLALFPQRSSMGELVLVHGAFLAVFAVYLAARSRPLFADARHRWMVVASVVVGAFAWAGGAPVVLLVGPILVLGWGLVRAAPSSDGEQRPSGDGTATSGRVATDGAVPAREGPAVGFETVLVVAGAGLVLLVEFVYLGEKAASGRVNTLFKTYSQVWLLWSVAAGAILARLLASRTPTTILPERGWTWSVRVLAVLVVAGTSVYAGFAIHDHVAHSEYHPGPDRRTLDALAFVATEHPEEAPAIAWLDRLEGRPTILTKPGLRTYRWVSAPATLTGLPTPAGWMQAGIYHGHDAYARRVDDVEAMYEGEPTTQWRLLAKYDVEYVYVGPQERDAYNVTVDRLESVDEAVAFENVTIYAVNQSRLSG